MEYQNWELIISGEYILWWDHHNEGIKKKFGFMHLTYKQSLRKPDQVRRKIIIQQANLEHTTNIYICRNTNRKKKKYTTSFFFFASKCRVYFLLIFILYGSDYKLKNYSRWTLWHRIIFDIILSAQEDSHLRLDIR